MIKKVSVFVALSLLLGCGQEKHRKHVDQPLSRPMPPFIPEYPEQPEQPSQKAPAVGSTPSVIEQDNIYGVDVPRNSSWYVEGTQFYHKGFKTSLKGINWFGFEGGNLVVHGLWTGRSIDSFLKQVKELGFNSLRIPVSPQVFESGYKSSHGKASPLENLTDVINTANSYGLSILLDLHTCHYNRGLVGDPSVCGGYEYWYKTLEKMAEYSKQFSNVLGIDLFNEPYNLSWKTWRDVASVAAKRCLQINPRILIFVEGVANNNTNNGGYGTYWGENLVEALNNMPDIPVSRSVLSPHVYGPSVAWQTYFQDTSFPSNMPNIWDVHFGYLNNKVPLVVGEFGGRYTGQDKVWQDAFILYMKNKGLVNFYYWSLNPNSGDTGGVLQDDWKSVNLDKMNLLKKLM